MLTSKTQEWNMAMTLTMSKTQECTMVMTSALSSPRVMMTLPQKARWPTTWMPNTARALALTIYAHENSPLSLTSTLSHTLQRISHRSLLPPHRCP